MCGAFAISACRLVAFYLRDAEIDPVAPLLRTSAGISSGSGNLLLRLVETDSASETGGASTRAGTG